MQATIMLIVGTPAVDLSRNFDHGTFRTRARFFDHAGSLIACN